MENALQRYSCSFFWFKYVWIFRFLHTYIHAHGFLFYIHATNVDSNLVTFKNTNQAFSKIVNLFFHKEDVILVHSVQMTDPLASNIKL